MIEMSPELYERVFAFVRTMTATCRACMRPKSYCDTCDLYTCRFLESTLRDLRKPINKRVKRINFPSFKERSAYYLDIVRKAGRYVTAREIDPTNSVCSRGLKYWTLRKMEKLGVLKTYCDGDKIFFGITNKETK